MGFQIYIDGQLTDQPGEDMQLSTTIKRDSDMGAFLITQDASISYVLNNDEPPGATSGYTLLRNAYDSGTCNELTVKIYDQISNTQTNLVYTGVISVPDMEVDLQRNKITSKISDNSFYSYISNNKKVPFDLYATKTKNGEPITPPTVYEVDMFDSATGTYLGFTDNFWKGYRLYDVLSFLVPAISDNKVTFASDYLTSGDIELFIFNGAALVSPNTSPAVTVSLEQILDELRKLKNLSFYIDQTDPDAPVLRLEDYGWFFGQSDILTFTEPLEVKSNIKTSKLYGTVRVGSGYNPGGSGPTYPWPKETSYYGWKEEVYTPYGQCNTDNELNLKNEFIIASNAINDQVLGAVEDNLESIFLVECGDIDDVAFTAIAVDYDTYSSGAQRWYNIGLNNVNKINLHGGNFQSALTNTADTGTDIFHASMGDEELIMDQTPGSALQSTFTNNPAEVTPLPFPDEFGGSNFDPGGNYDNLNYYYTAPVSGNYSFSTSLDFIAENFISCTTTQNTTLGQLNIPTQYGAIVSVIIEAFTDNTFTTLVDSSTTTLQIGLDGDYNVSANLTTPLSVGNAVRVRSSSQIIVMFPTVFGNTPLTQAVINGGTCGYAASQPKAQLLAQATSFFECNGTPEGGLTLAQPSRDLYKDKQYDFIYHIPADDFQTIKATPIGRFELVKHEVSRWGWIEELTYNDWTGAARVKLISQDATA